MRVCVLEDNPVTGELLTTVFGTLRGHDIQTFGNGSDLLMVCQIQGEFLYDLLLVDLLLPGMGGRETVRSLYRMLPSAATIPLVFITGAGNGEIALAREEFPKGVVIEKPFDYNTLLRQVSELVTSPRTITLRDGDA